jgi:hypothetical protein
MDKYCADTDAEGLSKSNANVFEMDLKYWFPNTPQSVVTTAWKWMATSSSSEPSTWI